MVHSGSNETDKAFRKGNMMNDDTIYKAIIAIDYRFHNGHLLQWFDDVPTSIKDIEDEYQFLKDIEFSNPHGIYVARFIVGIDECEHDWEVETSPSYRIKWDELL